MTRFTATKLADYSRCPFLYKALHVHRIPTGAIARHRGIVVHALSHVADSYATAGGRRAAVEALLERIRSDEDRQTARRLLAAYAMLQTGQQQILVEKTLTASISSTTVRVRPDRVEPDPQGDLCVIDIKTGKFIDTEHERVKMECATVALSQRFGRRTSSWIVFDLRAGQAVDLGPPPDARHCAANLARLVTAIQRRRFDPRPCSFCTRCPARSYCPEVNHTRRSQPRPLPPLSRAQSVAQTVQPTLF